MKIRNGFVSNSSSSSFVCNVCGSECSGWDMNLNEAEMMVCENGHIFCDTHAILNNKELSILLLEKNSKDNDLLEEVKNSNMCNYDYDDILDKYDSRYECPKENCPICSMVNILDKDMLNYLLKKYNISAVEVKDNIKKEFNSFEEFKNYIK